MLTAIRRNVTWRAIPVAGVIAGTAFLAVALLFSRLAYDVEPTLILRYFASLALGSGVLTEATTSTLLIGVLVHYVLSILFTLVIAIVVHRWGMLVGIVGGAILGACIYAINLYTMTYFFDWFFAINGTVLLAGHVLFGALAGGIYEYFDHFDLPLKENRNV